MTLVARNYFIDMQVLLLIFIITLQMVAGFIDMKAAGNTLYFLAINGTTQQILTLNTTTNKYNVLTSNLNQAEKFISLAVSPINKNLCILASSGYVYCSFNNGVSFTQSVSPQTGAYFTNFDIEDVLSFGVKSQPPWYELDVYDVLTASSTYSYTFKALCTGSSNKYYTFDGTALLDGCMYSKTFSAASLRTPGDFSDVFTFNLHTGIYSNPTYNHVKNNFGSTATYANGVQPCLLHQQAIGAFASYKDVTLTNFGNYNPNGWVFDKVASTLTQTFSSTGYGFTYSGTSGITNNPSITPIKSAKVVIKCADTDLPSTVNQIMYYPWAFDNNGNNKSAIVVTVTFDYHIDLCARQFSAAKLI